MPYYYDILSSSDDEDIIDFIDRRTKIFKTRHNYFEQLNDADFKIRFRMAKQTVMWLCNEIEEDLTFPSNKNCPLPPLDQLLLTLRLYATGSHHMSLADFSGITKTSAHRIASRVTDAIARLRPRFVKFPSTNEEIRQQQEKFYSIARFPKVVGCIDCTHVRVQSFGGEEAELFRNRKGYFSINVQAVSNANLEITNIVARWQGSVHDSTVFDNSRLCANFEQGRYGDAILLGDSDYPLKPYLLTPLLNPQDAAERRYNESHTRTRNTVECLFGIWKRRFPILALGIRYSMEQTMSTIVATAVLHNIARRAGDNLPANDPNINLPADWDHLIEYGNMPPLNAPQNEHARNAFLRNNLVRNFFQRL